jgi:acyl phosphate:glycerol-3-phosphate acyltransferase
MIVSAFVLAAFAYLLGSVPWGLVLTRRFSSVDILGRGSGNIGATNVRRLAGARLGAMTLAGDVLKGFVPVLAARVVFGAQDQEAAILVCAVAFAAFLGHLYPVYLKFENGGKGVATTFGCFLVVSPTACLVSLLAFLLVAYVSNRASAGSLAASAALPFAVRLTGGFPWETVFAAIFFVMIVVRHRSNIERLLRGTEPVINGREKAVR